MISEIIILYKLEQIDVVVSRFGKKKLLNQNVFRLLSLDYEIELALKKQGIPYESLREYFISNNFSPLTKEAIQHAGSFCLAPEIDFFQHRNIKLGEVVRQHTTNCIKEILYYLDVFNFIFETYSDIRHFWIPHLEPSVFSAHSLNQFISQIPIKVGKLLGSIRNLTVSELSYINKQHTSTLVKIRKRIINSIRRALLRLINFTITFTRSPQKLKFLVVDKWSNIKPFISKMNDVELVMLQPEEIRNIKWQAWKKRIRFYYPNDFLTSEIKKIAKNKQSQFHSQYHLFGENPKFSEGFYYNQISFWPVLKDFLDDVVNHWAEEIIRQIECINQILFRFSFNSILLQTTTKPKFHITAKLAQQKKVPVIELQHSSIIDAEKSVDWYLPVDYFVAYGDLTKRLFINHPQNTPQQIIELGSPRFDRYLLQQEFENKSLKSLRSDLNMDSSCPTILLIAPTTIGELGSWYFTSYDLKKFFQTLAKLKQEIPNARIIIKIRPDSSTRAEFYKKVIREQLPSDTIIAQHEDLQLLILVSDIVLSYKSTAVLEAMILGKPVVLFTIKEEPSLFKLFEEAGALRIAPTHEEVFNQIHSLILNKESCQKLVENANVFLQKHYQFDGKSSERMIDFLKKVRYNF